jgi:ABC-type polar amino acid transport system ATPase subunit
MDGGAAMTDGEGPILELDDLTVRYGAYTALDAVSLCVQPNERIVLIGPSGSGKSTMIRALTGFETPVTGTIRLFGRDIAGDARALRAARLRMGLIFQQFNLYTARTALENVALAPHRLKRLRRADADALALDTLARVGMAKHADRYPFQLSGGQQQRVAIARALAMAPDVLFLDEPTSALDPELVRDALALIEEIAAQGLTIVCATHEMELARRLADRVVFLCEGRIVETGPPAEIFAHQRSVRLAAFLSGGRT